MKKIEVECPFCGAKQTVEALMDDAPECYAAFLCFYCKEIFALWGDERVTKSA